MNILLIHTHDLGRYCQPYGYGIHSPNLQSFAQQGVLFGNAFCSAPTCSPSRAALLTGQYPHQCGMFGLANQDWALNDYSRHMAAYFGQQGYETAIAGAHHVTSDTPQGMARLPYERKLGGQRWDSFDVGISFLKEKRDRPFFLSLGSDITHHHRWQEACEHELGAGQHPDSRYVRTLPHLPNTPECRQEVADFYHAVSVYDRRFGQVIDALDQSGLADNTLVIFTTDHGPGLPGVKRTLQDTGVGVSMIIRGPGGFTGGRVIEAMVQQMDLYPTLCQLLGSPQPAWLEGCSIMPLIRDEVDQIHEAIFVQQNYHGSYSPLRGIRTERYKYIQRVGPALPMTTYTADKGVAWEFLVNHGYGQKLMPEEQLFDLVMDPCEINNLAGSPEQTEVVKDMRARLEKWQRQTDDPALTDSIPSPQGGKLPVH